MSGETQAMRTALRPTGWRGWGFRIPIGLTGAMVGLAAVAVAASLWFGSFITYVVGLAATWAIAGVGLNLLFGMCGLPALHGAAVLAVGAYAHAIFMQAGLPFALALCLAAIAGSVLGSALLFPILRLKGFYFAIASFILVLLVQQAANELEGLTGGPYGMTVGTPDLPGATGLQWTTIAAIGVAAISVVAYQAVKESIFGLRLRALRDSHFAAQSAGVSTWRYRAGAILFANLLVAAGGALAASMKGILDPTQFGAATALQTVFVGWIGGLDVAAGPLIGAGLVSIVPSVATSLQEYSSLVGSALLLIVLVVRPTGLLPLRRRDQHAEVLR